MPDPETAPFATEYFERRAKHEPLVSDKVATIIKEAKEKGLRDSPYNKKTYPLTGILKCGVCDANFTGDSGYYRCNAKSKIGKRCHNGGIAQAKLEQALSSLLSQVVLDFDNLDQIIDKISQRVETKDTTRLPALVDRLNELKSQKKKLIGLHLKSLIDDGELETELLVERAHIGLKSGYKEGRGRQSGHGDLQG